jgi:hypothetical protein
VLDAADFCPAVPARTANGCPVKPVEPENPTPVEPEVPTVDPPAPGPRAPEPERETISALLTYSVGKPSARSTRFSRMVVERVPAGATVKVSCKGHGCPKSVIKRNVSGTVSLKKFVGKPFRPGNVITITISKPGAEPAVSKLLIRSKRAPKTLTR